MSTLLDLNFLFTEAMLTTFLFCLNLENMKLFADCKNSTHKKIKFSFEAEDCKNSTHKKIKFTFEAEDLNSFLFLDVKINRKNKRFIISNFLQGSHIQWSFDKLCFIFDSYKVGLNHKLLFRYFKICSNMENFHIEVEQLRCIFKYNNYPVNIFDQCIKNVLDKMCVPKQIVSTVHKRNCQLFFHFQEHFL